MKKLIGLMLALVFGFSASVSALEYNSYRDTIVNGGQCTIEVRSSSRPQAVVHYHADSDLSGEVFVYGVERSNLITTTSVATAAGQTALNITTASRAASSIVANDYVFIESLSGSNSQECVKVTSVSPAGTYLNLSAALVNPYPKGSRVYEMSQVGTDYIETAGTAINRENATAIWGASAGTPLAIIITGTSAGSQSATTVIK